VLYDAAPRGAALLFSAARLHEAIHVLAPYAPASDAAKVDARYLSRAEPLAHGLRVDLQIVGYLFHGEPLAVR
jgi:hypothetical protein